MAGECWSWCIVGVARGETGMRSSRSGLTESF